jgi:alkylation response protein AidB-like acyl-CoA dehydrogenase
MTELMDRVRALADDVLFPAALEVDRTGVVPASHWEQLAAGGMYGMAAPPDLGGPGLDLPEIVEGLETMAGGCLATTFTWIQHHGLVMGLTSSPNAALRDELFADIVTGRTRAGVAFAGVIPDPPRVQAVRVRDGWRFSGDAPFVSGWGIVHLLQVSAGDVETGDIIGAVVEARTQPGITSVDRQHLVAANATNTVSIRFDDLVVPDDRVVSRVSRPDFLANQIFGARINGTLPLGLVSRCCRLLDEAGQVDAAARLGAERDLVRGRLDAGLADITAMVSARADAAQLALRAAAALVTAGGGPSLVDVDHAQRLAREAIFTLVAASRAELKRELLHRFSHPGGS